MAIALVLGYRKAFDDSDLGLTYQVKIDGRIGLSEDNVSAALRILGNETIIYYFCMIFIKTMRIKYRYTAPQSELAPIRPLKQILDGSNTESFEGGEEGDITW